MASRDAREAAQALRGLLATAGLAAEVLDAPGGAAVVVLARGGRVIGVFSPGYAGNLVWNNSALADDVSAAAFGRSDAWWNPGGDRTWIAPEADFFQRRYPEATDYFQPRQLDPGTYACTRGRGSVTLVNNLTLHSYRTGEDVRLRLAKTVAPLGPLALRKGFPARGLTCCGYTLTCTLEVLGDAPQTPVGIWNLLQLPPEGSMLIPTRGRGRAILFFGNIPAGDLVERPGLVRWTMSAASEQKIGVSWEEATGRVCHLRELRDRAVLAVRDFTTDPDGLYVDAPFPPTGDPACAVQACNVNSGLGRFNELEYHSPAIGGGTGRRSVTDTSRVRFFHGKTAAVRTLACDLLRVDSIP